MRWRDHNMIILWYAWNESAYSPSVFGPCDSLVSFSSNVVKAISKRLLSAKVFFGRRTHEQRQHKMCRALRWICYIPTSQKWWYTRGLAQNQRLRKNPSTTFLLNAFEVRTIRPPNGVGVRGICERTHTHTPKSSAYINKSVKWID